MTDVPPIKLSIPVGASPETAGAVADAVQRGDVAALEGLLAGTSGAALCTADARGLTPFHYAAIFGRAAVLSALLAHCPEGVAAHSSRGCTPLHHACRSRTASACVEPLLAAHADPAAADSAGWTALHYAAYAGCQEAARFLLDSYKSNNSSGSVEDLLGARTGDGDTALALALQRQHVRVAALLVARGAAVAGADGVLLLRRLRCAAPCIAHVTRTPGPGPLLSQLAALQDGGSGDGAAPCDARLCGAGPFAVPAHFAVVAARSRYCRTHAHRDAGGTAEITLPPAATERATRLFVRWCYTGELNVGDSSTQTDCELLKELLELCWGLNDDDDDEEEEKEEEDKMKDDENKKKDKELSGESWTEAVVETVVSRVDDAVVAALWPRVTAAECAQRRSCARLRPHLLAHVLRHSTPDEKQQQQLALDALIAATPREVLARTLASLPISQPGNGSNNSGSKNGNSTTAGSEEGNGANTASAEQLRALVPRFMAPACPPEVRREIERTNALLGPAVLRQRLGERVLGRCRELHARTLKQSGAHWFRDPVDEVQSGAVGYYTIIAHPMDLATLRRKYLDSGGGGSATLLDFVNDGRVMWQNSFRFNAPSTEPFVCAHTLALFWEAHVCRFFGPPKDRSGGAGSSGNANGSSGGNALALLAASLRPHAAPDLPLTRTEFEAVAQKLARLDSPAQERFLAMAEGDDSEASQKRGPRDIDLALLPPAKMRELAAFVDQEHARIVEK